MADVKAALWLHEEGKLRTVQADAADACILAVDHSQKALGVVAESFWLGEEGVGPPAILEASRVAALPCSVLQPICMCDQRSGHTLPAGIGSMPMKLGVLQSQYGQVHRIQGCIFFHQMDCLDTKIDRTGAARALLVTPVLVHCLMQFACVSVK